MKETIGEMIDRIQSVSRFGRKPKPVVYTDMETRSVMSMDPGQCDVDVLCMAVKVGDGPTHVVPWQDAMDRKQWAEAELIKDKVFASIRVQHQINYYDDLLWLDKSWLERKFLTCAAWARTLLKRSTDKPE